jgi:hypothetical protein
LDDNKISLYTSIGMGLTCLCIGWVIRDRIDNILVLIAFLIAIFGIFIKIYLIVDGERISDIVQGLKEEFSKHKG